MLNVYNHNDASLQYEIHLPSIGLTLTQHSSNDTWKLDLCQFQKDVILELCQT